ncbi:hypothetical protein BXY66_3967 [Shimia isoporae]|uniref:Uncharacterized protein n=1 Tax=Shimia isoporae TaxID=647720 RepID=A0A4R1N5B5_9RHOB|nr:hypothetical protein [Shimia isoporae]TCK99463.1 hypothetical protein BXY66_3967 [Shimia isoporae]
MPDPVSNAEIEDVLTSIRRLVSENRPVVDAPVVEETAADEVSEPAEEPVKNAPMALVLTPALRVEETDEAEGGKLEIDHAAEETPLDVSAYEADGGDSFSVEEAHQDDSNTMYFEEPENDETADFDGEEESENVLFEENVDDAIEELAEDVEEAVEDSFEEFEGSIEDLAVADVAHAGHEADAFSEEKHVDADMMPYDVEEEALESDLEVDVEDGRLEGRESIEEAGFVSVEETLEDDEEQDAPFDFKKVLEARLVQWRDGDASGAQDDEPVDSDYTEEEVAEAPIAQEEWSPEPETSHAEMSTEAPFDAIGDTIEAQVHEDVLEGAAATVTADLGEALDEPAVIDEEALREMVADIVRQELQGALGERITRNVRKLVRREIHRALAAHDLD